MHEFTAPTETIKFAPSNYDRKPKREIESRWVLNPVPEGQMDSHGPVVRVTMNTRHDPDSKVFRTSLTWETVEPAVPGSPFMVITWGSDHAMLTVGRNPVARYSAKAIEAEHAEMLEVLEGAFSSNMVQVIFNQAHAAVPVAEAV